MRKNSIEAPRVSPLDVLLDRSEPGDAEVVAIIEKMAAEATRWSMRSQRSSDPRKIEIWAAVAGIWRDSASSLRGQLRQMTQARNARYAVLNGDLELLDYYSRQRLGLPMEFEEVRRRIKGDRWPFRDALAEALVADGWLRPPGCTHVNRYLWNRAWQILLDRKKEDEAEHIKARIQGVVIVSTAVIRHFSPDAASNLVYDEVHDFEPPRLATLDLQMDVASNLDAIRADPELRDVLTGLLFEGQSWAELSDDDPKTFSTRFRRKHEAKLRSFRERMSAYWEPPPRRTLEERIAIEARNRKPVSKQTKGESY